MGDEHCTGGDFLELINLLSKFDDLLRQVIATPKYQIKYLSPAVQNEIIGLIAAETKNALVSKILEYPYFSIILDSTVDTAKVCRRLHLIFKLVIAILD